MLTKRSIEVLLRVERMMENATRTLTSDAEPRRGAAIAGPDTVAAADERAPRGN